MKLPFEKTYCLHLAEAHSRYLTSEYAFEKVGILDQVEYWWTVKRPFINKCIDKFPNLRTSYYDSYGDPNIYNNVFNCAYEHYNIIKQAYLREIESIIIFEDDIFIHVDENKFENMMNNVPSDYDIIQFYDTNRWYSQYEHVQYNIENNDITKFIKISNEYHDYNKCSCLCYALSRRGMKEIIDIHDNYGLIIADNAFNKIDTTKINYYIPEYIVISPIDTDDSASYILNVYKK